MELISTHIPKTAGTAFTRVLQRNYGENSVYLDYDGGKNRAIDRNISVIHGHFRHRRYADAYPEVKRVVWLRNPVRRVISHYYFVKFGPRREDNALSRTIHDENLSLHEFIELRPARNCQSKFTEGLPLEDYFFVGLQEHFAEDLAVLGRMLGWRHVHARRFQKNGHADYRSRVKAHLDDRALVHRIRRINSLDMALYRHAVSLRAQRPSVGTLGRGDSLHGALQAVRSILARSRSKA